MYVIISNSNGGKDSSWMIDDNDMMTALYCRVQSRCHVQYYHAMPHSDYEAHTDDFD